MVLDYLSTTLQRYEKILRLPNISAFFFALKRRKKSKKVPRQGLALL
jgi:hypothetical protein